MSIKTTYSLLYTTYQTKMKFTDGAIFISENIIAAPMKTVDGTYLMIFNVEEELTREIY